MLGPSRAIQMIGSPSGLLGLRRYCQSHRRRLASAASLPNTRRYSASTLRRSSGRKRSTSAIVTRRQSGACTGAGSGAMQLAVWPAPFYSVCSSCEISRLGGVSNDADSAEPCDLGGGLCGQVYAVSVDRRLRQQGRDGPRGPMLLLLLVGRLRRWKRQLAGRGGHQGATAGYRRRAGGLLRRHTVPVVLRGRRGWHRLDARARHRLWLLRLRLGLILVLVRDRGLVGGANLVGGSRPDWGPPAVPVRPDHQPPWPASGRAARAGEARPRTGSAELSSRA